METQVGKITHYYTRIGVAVLALTDELKLADEIHVLGRITDFHQYVNSLEINHQKIERAGPGMEVALLLEEYARAGDAIFKVT
jgi:hypothetical protein